MAAHTFSLEDSGCGGGPYPDNDSFTISGDELLTSEVFDFEARDAYTICIRTTDGGSPGLTYDEEFEITVEDAADPSYTLETYGCTPANQPYDDNAAFIIDGADLRTNEVLDWEKKTSYTLCIRATDSRAAARDEEFTVTVVNATDIIINEVDVDQEGADNAEFVELYDGGVGNSPLDELAIVLYDGSTDEAYDAFDLDGYSTDADGYFVLCGDSAAVANCDWDVSPDVDLLQDEAEAVALYVDDDASFPDGTSATDVNLLDAIVYDVNQSDDAGLLGTLLTGGDQVNEDDHGDSGGDSMQRLPDGSGDARDTSAYAVFEPTAGAANVNDPPSVSSIVRSDSNPTNADSVDFTVTFSESVTGVDKTDFFLTATGAFGNVGAVAGSGDTRTVTVDSIAGNGSLRLDATDDDTITDGVDSLGPGDGSFSAGETYTIDNTEPTVNSIDLADATPTNADSVDFTVTFSESVSDIETGDFALATTGTAAGSIAGVSSSSGDSVTVTVNSISGDGTLGLNFDVDALDNVADAAGNTASADFTGQIYTIDAVAPSVSSITRDHADPTNADSVDFTVTFSESVNDIETGDFELARTGTANGAISSVSASSGATVTVTVSGITGDGTLGLNFDFDALDNVVDWLGNTASADFAGPTYTIDNTAPTVTAIDLADSSPTNANSVNFTVTFSETVSDIETGDFTPAAAGTVFGAISGVSAASGATVTVTAYKITGDGTLGLNFDFDALDSVSDSAGNAAAADFTGQTYTIDNTPPAVSSIDRADADPTNADSVSFTVTFSETVNDIETGDFALATTDSAAGSIAAASAAGGDTVTVTVDSVVGDGDLGLNFDFDALDSVSDAAGNTVSADFTGSTYTIDNTAPTISAIDRVDADPTNADDVRFTVTFSETVSDIETGDFALATTDAAVGSIAGVSASSGDTATVTVDSIAGDGTLGLNFDFDALDNISDSAGNVISADFTGQIYTIDNTAPTVSSIDRAGPDPTSANSVTFTVIFSEAVEDIETGDFAPATTGDVFAAVDGASASSGTTVTVTVYKITGDGSLGLNFDFDALDSVSDSAGNAASTDFTGQTYTIDNTAPTISSIDLADSSPTNADSVDFTVTFSETVEDIETGDFALATTGDAAGSIADVSASSGDTVTVTADSIDGDGELGLNFDVDALDGVSDSAGNMATENFTGSTYTLDNTAPELTSFTRQTPATSPIPSDALVFLATFDSDVRNVDETDFSIDGATTGAVTLVEALSDASYEITVSGGDLADFDGIVGLDLSAGQDVTDEVGNALPAGEPGTDETYTLDNTAPGLVSFTRRTPATSPTNADSLVFLATFDSDVQHVDAADFSIDGAVSDVIMKVDALSADVYEITLAEGELAEFDGTLGLDLDAGQDITDEAGLPLPDEEPGVDETFTVDNTAPTVTDVTSLAADGAYTTGDVIDVIVRFDEIVHVDGAPQLTLETGESDAVVAHGSGSGGDALSFPYTVVHGHGTTDLDCISTSALALNGGAIRDDAGNDAAITLPAPGAAGSLGANRDLVIDTMEFDGDGVSNAEESGPDQNDTGYDGNNDGTPDYRQQNVASLFTANGDYYVTLSVPEGLRLVGVRAVHIPSPVGAPDDVAFPYGFFEFRIEGLVPGEEVEATLHLPDGPTPHTYFKFGPTPTATASHWYEFMLDKPVGEETGAEIAGAVVVMHFVDGLRGDDDLTADGVIIDQGGPGVADPQITPVPTLSEWGLILFALMLPGSAVFRLLKLRAVSVSERYYNHTAP